MAPGTTTLVLDGARDNVIDILAVPLGRSKAEAALDSIEQLAREKAAAAVKKTYPYVAAVGGVILLSLGLSIRALVKAGRK